VSLTKDGVQESYQLQQGWLHLSQRFSQMLFRETDTGHFDYDSDQTSINHLLQELILFPLP
jgi:hypothetical protein